MPELRSPRLELEPAPGSKQRPALYGVLRSLVVLVVVLQGAILYRLLRAPPAAGGAGAPVSAQEAFDLAIALEQKSLPREAALAFERFLDRAPPTKERAAQLYHAGKLRLEAGDHAQAAAHFVAAELRAKADGVKLPDELGRSLVDCLRRLGHYGEVGRELARRVDTASAGEPGKVLARYAGAEITDRDLDRMIERRVDQTLELQGLDTSARESILAQFEQPEQRTRVLQEFLQTDLLARRAREVGLDQKPEFKEAAAQTEQVLLAQLLLQGELASRKATEADLTAYFDAHRREYRTPSAADVVWIDLEEGEDDKELLSRAGAAESFLEEAGRRGPLQRARLVEGTRNEALGDYQVALLKMQPGDVTPQALEVGGQRRLALVERVDPAKDPEFSEVAARVAEDYSRRKLREISEELLADLMQRYQVEIVAPDSAVPAASKRP